MTTSPFGTPNPYSPSGEAPDAGPVPSTEVPGSSRRTPVLLGIVGLAAAAAVGGGLFFFGQSGADDQEAVALPAGSATAPAPEATPTDAATPLPTLTQFNGRNPFAAQVVPGGVGAAPASTPVATSAPVSTGSSAFTGGSGTAGGSGSGSVPGAAGADGLNGIDGADGTDGAAGLDGTDGIDGIDGEDGVTPQYLQVTYRFGDAGNPLDPNDDLADFDLLVPTGPDSVLDVMAGALLGEDGPATWVQFNSLQLDDADQPVAALVQMGDRMYLLPLDQPVTLFQATTAP